MNKITLSKYAKVQGGYAYKSSDFLSSGLYRVLKIKNIRFGYVDYDDTAFIDDKLADKTIGWQVKPSDILISMTGSGFNAPASLVGRVAKVRENEPVAFINQRIGRIIVSEKISSDYVYYLLSQKKSQEYFVTNATGSANQVNINASTILSLDIPDIEPEKTFKIADILGAFDDKIQLNTQINQTLEQMAAAIFKSWFIDFDPVRAKADAIAQGADHEQANIAAMTAISGKTAEELAALPSENYTELYTLADNFPSEFEMVDGVEVPRGWGYDKLNNLFNVGIGKTPPRKEEHWFTENTNDVEWISIKDMGNQGAFIMQSSEYLKEEAIEKFKIKVIPQNTVILSFKLTLGRVAITTKNTTTNEAIAHFKLNKNTKLSTEYLYLWLKQYDFGSLGSTSSIATAVNSKTIKDMLILIPNSKLLDFFNKKIGVFFEKIRNTTEENISLEEMRDLLLPKLLSGEIEL